MIKIVIMEICRCFHGAVVQTLCNTNKQFQYHLNMVMHLRANVLKVVCSIWRSIGEEHSHWLLLLLK